MNTLSQLLTHIREKNNNPELVDTLSESLQLAEQQAQEIQRLTQVISDIRERDARKKCLCRGMG